VLGSFRRREDGEAEGGLVMHELRDEKRLANTECVAETWSHHSSPNTCARSCVRESNLRRVWKRSPRFVAVSLRGPSRVQRYVKRAPRV
jgi:hypothetical protein